MTSASFPAACCGCAFQKPRRCGLAQRSAQGTMLFPASASRYRGSNQPVGSPLRRNSAASSRARVRSGIVKIFYRATHAGTTGLAVARRKKVASRHRETLIFSILASSLFRPKCIASTRGAMMQQVSAEGVRNVSRTIFERARNSWRRGLSNDVAGELSGGLRREPHDHETPDGYSDTVRVR